MEFYNTHTTSTRYGTSVLNLSGGPMAGQTVTAANPIGFGIHTNATETAFYLNGNNIYGYNIDTSGGHWFTSATNFTSDELSGLTMDQAINDYTLLGMGIWHANGHPIAAFVVSEASSVMLIFFGLSMCFMRRRKSRHC